MSLQIINNEETKPIQKIETMQEFYNMLQINNSVVIFKFGADWCSPCKKIEPTISQWFQHITINTNIQAVYVDVDEAFELYSFLRTKKMIKGIPAVLAYYKGNTGYIFDDAEIGTDVSLINSFFERCTQKANEITK